MDHNDRVPLDESRFYFIGIMKNDEKIITEFQNKYKDNLGITIIAQKRLNALHLSCQSGNLKLVDFLLQTRNININELNLSGETPFELAVKSRQYELVIYFLKKHFDELVSEESNFNAFGEIISQFGGGAFEYLIQNCVFQEEKPINWIKNIPGTSDSLISLVIEKRTLFEFDQILNENLYINAEDSIYLYHACSKGRLDIVNYLCSKFPDIEVNNTHGYGSLTPLLECCKRDYHEIVQALVNYPNIDVNKCCPDDLPPILIGIVRKCVQTVKILCQCENVEPDIFYDGKTIFEHALDSRNLEIIQCICLLLKSKKHIEDWKTIIKNGFKRVSKQIGNSIEILQFLISQTNVFNLETSPEWGFWFQTLMLSDTKNQTISFILSLSEFRSTVVTVENLHRWMKLMGERDAGCSFEVQKYLMMVVYMEMWKRGLLTGYSASDWNSQPKPENSRDMEFQTFWETFGLTVETDYINNCRRYCKRQVEVLALVVLFSDNYLKLKFNERERSHYQMARRFFRIVHKLPWELKLQISLNAYYYDFEPLYTVPKELEYFINREIAIFFPGKILSFPNHENE